VSVNRRLLTGADHMSTKQWRRLGQMLDDHDPDQRDLRRLRRQGTPPDGARQHETSKIRWRLADFYDAVIGADLPEAT